MKKFQNGQIEDTKKSSNKGLIGGAVASVVLASSAMASFTAPTLSTSEPTTVAVAVLAGLGALWGIMKAVGVMKRG